MDPLLLCGLTLSLIAISLIHYLHSTQRTAAVSDNRKRRLPPGSMGLPLIGESIDFMYNYWKGESEKFIFPRMAKHSVDVFRTSVLGDTLTIIGGASGSKFLFANGNKLVKQWRLKTLRLLFLDEATDSKERINTISAFVKPDNLRNFVGIMDSMAQHHLDNEWHNEVKVQPLVKSYAFALACRLFMSIEDPNVVRKLMHPMETIVYGIVAIPINFPGTLLNRALIAANDLQKQISEILTLQKTRELSTSHDSDDSHRAKNIVSNFLKNSNNDPNSIAKLIIAMLVASHDTTTSVMTMIFKIATDYPHVYQRLYEENMEVAAHKGPGELLTWEDIQKLRYSWNVAREVMRKYSPVAGIFREAIKDFIYAGYDIPQGSTIYASAHAIHKDPRYYPDPEKFDPSRFDGDGPLPYTFLPFGGGPNMCPGISYAQAAMVSFIHNAVKRFKWESLLPSEKMISDPFPRFAKGFPVLLHPHAP